MAVSLDPVTYARAIVGHRRSPAVYLAVALVALAGVAAAPRPARAVPGTWLRWNDCEAAGMGTLVINCVIPVFQRSMFASVGSDSDITQVVGASLVLDVITDSPTLVDWWRLGPGDCRAGKLGASADLSSGLACVDAWNLEGSGLIQVYGTRPGSGANQARFVATAGVSADSAVTLPAGQTRGIVRVFMFLSDAATSPCAGCSTGACVVLNSVQLVRLPGAPGGDITLSEPAEDGSNYAMWQSGAACVTVPAVNRSWGQIKAMYR